MNECLPLVKQSQAEVLILLSDKNVDCDLSKVPNANTSKHNKQINYLIICNYFLFVISF